METTQPIRSKKKLERFRNYYKEVEKKPRNYALIVFGLNSALRIGDILNLKWEDVEKDGRYRNHITLIERKTGKQNRLAINRSIREALEYYRHSLGTIYPEDYIFVSQKSKEKPITRCQAFRIVQKAARECKLEDSVSCHSLRKTFGYFAWKNGTPPALLMNIYNHSSYEITKRYLGIDQYDKDEVYKKNLL